MTTPRLHLTRITQAETFEAQAAALFAKATANLPVEGDCSTEALWSLAQYVDLVDAGLGSKTGVYLQAQARLAAYARTVATNATGVGRSARLHAYVNRQVADQVLCSAPSNPQVSLSLAA